MLQFKAFYVKCVLTSIPAAINTENKKAFPFEESF